MAFETGTATNHEDLYNKLITFLTENEDLVAEGQNWEVVWTGMNNNGEVVLKGPGLAGQDAVFVGIRRVWDPLQDEYRIELQGMAGVIASAASMGMHVNVSDPCWVFFDSQPMTYWFVANGRRFAGVVKISTVFEAFYCGLFLPYAPPTTYPYPLFIGGSNSASTSTEIPKSWRSTNNVHRHFIDPNININTPVATSTAFMLDPMGQWLRGVNLVNGSVSYVNNEGSFHVGPRFFHQGMGASATNESSRVNYRSANERIVPAFGGSYVLIPMTLTASHPTNQTYGILDGIYDVSGYANSSENIVQLDYGDDRIVDHLVVQNVFRTGLGQYWALALE